LRTLVASYKTLSCDINSYPHGETLNWAVNEMNRVVSHVNNSLRNAKKTLSPCQNVTPEDGTIESIQSSASWALSALGFIENLPQKADACLARLEKDKDSGKDRVSDLRSAETGANKPIGQDSGAGSGTNINVRRSPTAHREAETAKAHRG